MLKYQKYIVNIILCFYSIQTVLPAATSSKHGQTTPTTMESMRTYLANIIAPGFNKDAIAAAAMPGLKKDTTRYINPPPAQAPAIYCMINKMSPEDLKELYSLIAEAEEEFKKRNADYALHIKPQLRDKALSILEFLKRQYSQKNNRKSLYSQTTLAKTSPVKPIVRRPNTISPNHQVRFQFTKKPIKQQPKVSCPTGVPFRLKENETHRPITLMKMSGLKFKQWTDDNQRPYWKAGNPSPKTCTENTKHLRSNPSQR